VANDLFGDLPEDGMDEEFEELRSALAEALAAFADEQEIGEDVLSLLLIDAAVVQRALAYVLATDKPSEGGLKLDLDRFGRAFNDLLRGAKKNARPTLQHLTAAVAEALAAVEGEEEE
jgi:hypothetical protein